MVILLFSPIAYHQTLISTPNLEPLENWTIFFHNQTWKELPCSPLHNENQPIPHHQISPLENY